MPLRWHIPAEGLHMKIRIKLLADLSRCFSERVLEVQEGKTAGGLIQDISMHDEAFRKAIFDEHGHIKGFINILLNGRRLDMSHESSVLLVEDDEIVIFSYVAGG
jgi:molybdopterin converting factor small subunit